MRSLFIFSIGPVQEFIATARRSRDLWYGSWMLSELSKAAAKSIWELSPAGELIFPCPVNKNDLEDSQFNAPNKIVAVIDGDPAEIGKVVKTAIKKKLDLLWENARQHVKGSIDDALAQKQIDDLLEFYWVSVPYHGDYSIVRDSAEFLFSARKGTRNFAQAKGTSIPKSSLDGARETVIHKNEYPERSDNEITKKQKTENLYKRYHARRGEQLSGVDILKRLGSPDNSPTFKSTSDMAALPFLNLVDRKQGGKGKGKELLEKLKTLLPDERDRLDGAEEGLVFENRFADGFPSQDPDKEEHSRLLKEYAGNAKPNPYYALLAADGDNMGAAIDAQNEYQTHQELSHALSAFASQVSTIVKDGQGVTIYAGGDDVLAYLPLHTILDVAGKLENAFRTALEKYKTKDGISPTLSVGIAVSHQVEPLSDALELVHNAEKEAKSVPGKNGLAIIVSKRSGADRVIKGKFNILEKRLLQLVNFSVSDAISAGSAYELQNLHRDLSLTGIPAEGISAEAMRILKRKREAGSDKTVENKVLVAFQEWIEKDKIKVDALAIEMLVAKMFAIQEAKEPV